MHVEWFEEQVALQTRLKFTIVVHSLSLHKYSMLLQISANGFLHRRHATWCSLQSSVSHVKRTLTGRITTSYYISTSWAGQTLDKISLWFKQLLKHCLHHVCPCLSSAYFSSSVRVSFTQTVVLSRPLRKAPRMKSWAKHATTSNDLQESARHIQANDAMMQRFTVAYFTDLYRSVIAIDL